MINRIQRRLHTLALASLVTAGSLMAPFVSADTFDCGIDVSAVYPLVMIPGLVQTPSSPDGAAPVQTVVTSQSSSAGRSALPSTACREMAPTEELCGWVDMAEVLPKASSVPSDVTAEASEAAEFAEAFARSLAGSWQDVVTTNHAKPSQSQVIAQQPQPNRRLTPAGIATSLVAATGVKVQQFVEPFAMVGPSVAESIAESIASVQTLQSWLAELADSGPANTETTLRAAIDALAMEEPLDANGFADPIGPPTPQPVTQPSIVVTRLDPLVGSGPIMMTIRVEEYLAYDLAPRDMMVWALPSMSRTFCVREQLDRAAKDSMWDDAEEAGDMIWQSTTDLVQSSPECLMDDLMCRIQSATVSVDLVAIAQPRSLGQALGRSLASVVQTSTRAAGQTIRSVATWMPKTDAVNDRPVPGRMAKQNTCTVR